jgi:hypothetical protein
MKNYESTLQGVILATAVAAAFISNPVLAQESGSPVPPPTYVGCLGVNTCKGKSMCKSFDHECQGMNSCKGKGFIEMKSAKQCTDKGGKVIDPDQM